MLNTHRVALCWFRRDLRLADNPALSHAIQHAEHVIPVYIHAPQEEAPWPPGAASRWWLHHGLHSLNDSLVQLGNRLIIRRGDTLAVLQSLIAETGATLVTWNRLYEPACIARDTAVKKALRESGVEVHSDNSALLFEPWTIHTKQHTPFKVFTPFWKTCRLQLAQQPAPLPAPTHLAALHPSINSLQLDELALLPTIRWDNGIAQRWQAGESHALPTLQHFIDECVHAYATQRDQPAVSGTSSLSPHLHFGEISPRQILAAINLHHLNDATSQGAEVYIKELGWREFAYHLLYHFPHTTAKPLDVRFEKFPWQKNEHLLKAWQKGVTGIPLVDAGMRELWHTGWMHNRVRMIVASFLCKNLQINWVEGARWFWDTLVDADLASNTLGWQWTAGCGADAAPYFRIFNPVLQAERFDPDAMYIRKWIPELNALPNRWITAPWAAPDKELTRAGIKLGQHYPEPIVDLNASREHALRAYSQLKSETTQ
ncbi:MAG: deoxyribodipyrimidine photo-lyase [Steroidobacter sp.]